MSMKNSSDSIINRFCDVPVFIALPQSLAPPAAIPNVKVGFTHLHAAKALKEIRDIVSSVFDLGTSRG
jgi:hypothetical protein